MARPKKINLDYYSSDTDRYQDKKIKRLKKEFSCNGIAIWDYLLNEVYRVNGSFLEWDEDTAFDVSEYFNIKESLVKEVVNYCCNVGLFNKELRASESVLTSKAIQERYLFVCKLLGRNYVLIPEKINLLQKQDSFCDVKTEFPTLKTQLPSIKTEKPPPKSTQKKRKETKGKERKEKEACSHQYFSNELYFENSQWKEVCLMKNRIKNKEQLRKMLKEFQEHLILKNTKHNDYSSFKDHFNNWAGYQKTKNINFIETKKNNAEWLS